jgi:hypothetical protein
MNLKIKEVIKIYESITVLILLVVLITLTYKHPKEYQIIIYTALGLLSACVLIYIIVFEDSYGADLTESLLPNFITDLFFIPITVFLITYLVNKAQEKKAKKEAFKAIGLQHLYLTSRISGMYINLLTKMFVQSEVDIYVEDKKHYKFILYKLYNTIEDIDSYIDEDFTTTNMIHEGNLAVDTLSNIEYFDGYKVLSSPQPDSVESFRIQSKQLLSEYISKYISILPPDLARKITALEGILLRDNLSFSLTDIYFNVGTDDQHSEPVEVKILKENYYELGKAILSLHAYYNDEYHKKT